MGRLAASLLPRPLYIEGSYDELLLEENIVTPSFGFGRGGKRADLPGPRDGLPGGRTEARSEFSRARLAGVNPRPMK